MLKLIVGGLVLLIVVALGVGLVLPRDYKLVRTVTVKAAPAQIAPWLADLKKWPEWAPWQEEDPTVKTTFGAKTVGVGASQTWTSTGGDGRLVLTRCDEQGIAYDMVFIEGGHETPAKCWMSLKPAAGGTEVAWGMEGKIDTPVIGGYFTLFMPAMVGGMFDKGLDKLKSKAETAK